jgi:hypothetical protein
MPLGSHTTLLSWIESIQNDDVVVDLLGFLKHHESDFAECVVGCRTILCDQHN